MSGYVFGNWFARLFCSASPLAKKKHIARVAGDVASSILHDWGSEKDFKESVSQNLRSGTRSLGEPVKLRQSKKGLKRARNTTLLISLNLARKCKTSCQRRNQK